MAGLTINEFTQRAEAMPEENSASEDVILHDDDLLVDETGMRNFETFRAGAYEKGDEFMSTVEITCVEAHPTHPKIAFKCDCGKATENVETAAVNSVVPCRHVIRLFNEMDFDELLF